MTASPSSPHGAQKKTSTAAASSSIEETKTMSHEVVARLRQLGVRRGIVCSATTSGLSTAVSFQLVAAAAYGTSLVGVRGIVGRTQHDAGPLAVPGVPVPTAALHPRLQPGKSGANGDLHSASGRRHRRGCMDPRGAAARRAPKRSYF